MKRFLLIALLALAAHGLHAQNNTVPAQTRTTNLPGHEWTINGFGGISTLGYKVDGASLKRGLAGGAGFGYHYFFNDRWGLVTGLDAALYKASLSSDMMYSGQYFSVGTPVPGDVGEKIVLRHRLANFKESQSVYMLQLPVMAQWMAPVGKAKNNHFYLALGARLGYSFSGKFNQSASGIDYLTVDNLVLQYPERSEWYPVRTYDDQHPNGAPKTISTGKQTLKFSAFNAMASAEMGFRWKLGERTGLYTGLYVDYGFVNIAPKVSGEALYMPVDGGEGYPSEYQGVRNNSVLAAHASDYGEIYNNAPGQNPQVRWVQNDAGYAGKVRTFGAGLRIKIAFGGPKRKPAPAPVVVPPPAPAPEPEPIPEPEPAPVPEPEPVIEVPPVIKKAMMDLSNTLFAFDRFNLSDEAVVELDKVSAWLNENPEISVEIGGHTDSYGSDDYNLRLSEERAKAVHDYFVEHGVNAPRLSYRGYGEANPIADNSTDEGRRHNRRVELKIVEPTQE